MRCLRSRCCNSATCAQDGVRLDKIIERLFEHYISRDQCYAPALARLFLHVAKSSSEGLTTAYAPPPPCAACKDGCAAQRIFSWEDMRNKGIAMSLRLSLHSWMLLKKERRDLSTLMVPSSLALCWKVKMSRPFGSGAAAIVLQLRTNTVSEHEQGYNQR